jgi:glycosyltransferase involved in cell wall biosynthesis
MRAEQQLPLVSTVIPTLNRPQLVRRAVLSALDQTYSNLEIVVVVDGLDLDTVEELEMLQEPRLRVIALPENAGPATARNIGVRESRGEWIAFLDDDDEWLPEKTAKQISSSAHIDPAINFVSCRVEERNRDTSCVKPHDFPRPGENLSEYMFCRGGLLLPSTYLVKRTVMLAVPFRNGLRGNEDSDWLFRAQAAGVISPRWVDDVLTIYHNEASEDRLSIHPEWRDRYQWLLESPGLLTKRSVPFYLGRICIPEARRSSAPLRDCCFLLKEAALRGKLSARAIFYLTVVTLSSRKWRKGVRMRLGFAAN